MKIIVEKADTPEKREKGLMNRASLPAGHGMLFVYEDDGPRSFWMKNTSIPLDICFLDGDMKVRSVGRGIPHSLKDVTGTGRYVLEVNHGEAPEVGETVECSAESAVEKTAGENDIRHILLTGIPGSGKTTSATELSRRTGMPIVHGDDLWKPGDNPTANTTKLLRAKIKKLTKPHIIEGVQLMGLQPHELKKHDLRILEPPQKTVVDRLVNRGWDRDTGEVVKGERHRKETEDMVYDYTSLLNMVKYSPGFNDRDDPGIIVRKEVPKNTIFQVAYVEKGGDILPRVFGRRVQHSDNPNMEIVHKNNTYYLRTLRPLEEGERFTADRTTFPWTTAESAEKEGQDDTLPVKGYWETQPIPAEVSRQDEWTRLLGKDRGMEVINSAQRYRDQYPERMGYLHNNAPVDHSIPVVRGGDWALYSPRGILPDYYYGLSQLKPGTSLPPTPDETQEMYRKFENGTATAEEKKTFKDPYAGKYKVYPAHIQIPKADADTALPRRDTVLLHETLHDTNDRVGWDWYMDNKAKALNSGPQAVEDFSAELKKQHWSDRFPEKSHSDPLSRRLARRFTPFVHGFNDYYYALLEPHPRENEFVEEVRRQINKEPNPRYLGSPSEIIPILGEMRVELERMNVDTRNPEEVRTAINGLVQKPYANIPKKNSTRLDNAIRVLQDMDDDLRQQIMNDISDMMPGISYNRRVDRMGKVAFVEGFMYKNPRTAESAVEKTAASLNTNTRTRPAPVAPTEPVKRTSTPAPVAPSPTPVPVVQDPPSDPRRPVSDSLADYLRRNYGDHYTGSRLAYTINSASRAWDQTPAGYKLEKNQPKDYFEKIPIKWQDFIDPSILGDGWKDSIVRGLFNPDTRSVILTNATADQEVNSTQAEELTHGVQKRAVTNVKDRMRRNYDAMMENNGRKWKSLSPKERQQYTDWWNQNEAFLTNNATLESFPVSTDNIYIQYLSKKVETAARLAEAKRAYEATMRTTVETPEDADRALAWYLVQDPAKNKYVNERSQRDLLQLHEALKDKNTFRMMMPTLVRNRNGYRDGYLEKTASVRVGMFVKDRKKVKQEIEDLLRNMEKNTGHPVTKANINVRAITPLRDLLGAYFPDSTHRLPRTALHTLLSPLMIPGSLLTGIISKLSGPQYNPISGTVHLWDQKKPLPVKATDPVLLAHELGHWVDIHRGLLAHDSKYKALKPAIAREVAANDWAIKALGGKITPAERNLLAVYLATHLQGSRRPKPEYIDRARALLGFQTDSDIPTARTKDNT